MDNKDKRSSLLTQALGKANCFVLSHSLSALEAVRASGSNPRTAGVLGTSCHVSSSFRNCTRKDSIQSVMTCEV